MGDFWTGDFELEIPTSLFMKDHWNNFCSTERLKMALTIIKKGLQEVKDVKWLDFSQQWMLRFGANITTLVSATVD